MQALISEIHSRLLPVQAETDSDMENLDSDILVIETSHPDIEEIIIKAVIYGKEYQERYRLKHCFSLQSVFFFRAKLLQNKSTFKQKTLLVTEKIICKYLPTGSFRKLLVLQKN